MQIIVLKEDIIIKYKNGKKIRISKKDYLKYKKSQIMKG